jgi:hypothetical protein
MKMSNILFFRYDTIACRLLFCLVIAAALHASPITQARTGQEAPVRPTANEDSTSSTQGREPASIQKGRGQSEHVPVLKEYTDVVTVNVMVTDSSNRLVTGLGREHFEIYEDNVRQTLEYFIDIDTPASIGYVPTSLKRDGKFHKIKVRINPPRGLPSLTVQTKEGYYAARNHTR